MDRWTPEQAHAWYARQPWLVGCNFIPSSAINQLEMWQAETFDPGTLERELTWAAELGFNTLRVYLHDLAWEADVAGFLGRMHHFLELTSGRGIRPIFVFFDDCWNESAKIGRQPESVPGVHNCGWLQSPVKAAKNNPSEWPRLQKYVQEVLVTFGRDERVLMWDLYNEPGNSAQEEGSLPLLTQVFEWARATCPHQPLTAGLWYGNTALNAFQTTASDIITFHDYQEAAHLARHIEELRRHGRPLICTEWLRRCGSATVGDLHGNSEVATCLPVFHREKVGCLNWGFVAGKTQTIFPWGSKPGAPEPARWFHDLLRPDGSPFDPEEVRLFRTLTDRGLKPAHPMSR